MEFRGEVRRGYFVRGLSGAQFATPVALDLLRHISGEEATAKPLVLLAASDPANVYNLSLDAAEKDPLSRPRGAGALLVTRGGKVILSIEGRGRRVVKREGASAEEIIEARRLAAAHLRGEKTARYLMLPDTGTSPERS